MEELFRATYLADAVIRPDVWSVHSDPSGAHRFVCTLDTGDRTADLEGTGSGPLTAFADALAGAGYAVEVLEASDQPVSDGTAAYAECRVGGVTVWGAGIAPSPLAARVAAVVSAVNRAAAR
ncbi:hypothetical protein GCM10020256_21800 [Streptomyces thermocoprophilus]